MPTPNSKLINLLLETAAHQDIGQRIVNAPGLLKQYSDAIFNEFQIDSNILIEKSAEIQKLPIEIVTRLAIHVSKDMGFAAALPRDLRITFFSALVKGHTLSAFVNRDSSILDILNPWIPLLEPNELLNANTPDLREKVRIEMRQSINAIEPLLEYYKKRENDWSKQTKKAPYVSLNYIKIAKKHIGKHVFSWTKDAPFLLQDQPLSTWMAINTDDFFNTFEYWPIKNMWETLPKISKFELPETACDTIARRIADGMNSNTLHKYPIVCWNTFESEALTKSLVNTNIPFDGPDIFFGTHLVKRLSIAKNRTEILLAKIGKFISHKEPIPPITADQWELLFDKLFKSHGSEANIGDYIANIVSVSGSKPCTEILLNCICSGRLDWANAIIKAGAQLDFIDAHGNSVWHYVLMGDHEKYTKTESGFSPARIKEHFAPFYDSLWKQAGHLINHVNNDGRTPLFMANPDTFNKSNVSFFPSSEKLKFISSIDSSITGIAFTPAKYKFAVNTVCNQATYSRSLLSSTHAKAWLPQLERKWLLDTSQIKKSTAKNLSVL